MSLRRPLVVVCALLLLGLAGGTVSAVSAQAETRLRANERAARRDARALLASLRLPGGVTRTDSAPSFTKPFAGGGALGEGFFASDKAWWTTSANPQAIIDYVKAHKPAGASITTWGSGGGPGTTSLDVMLSWPALGVQVFDRTLTVSVVTPANGGRSAIVARSQSYWIVPRPAAERVPSAAHAVAVTLRIGSGPQGSRHMHISTYVVWRRARVASIVRTLDRLPIVQPGVVYSCPAVIGGVQSPMLMLAFKTGRDPADRTLARAQVSVWPGKHGASGWDECDPIDFWIGAKQQTPLTSQTFVKQIGKLIGADIS